MELKQSLADAKKEAAENDKYIHHWTAEHDKLSLVDVEYVTLAILLSHYFNSFIVMMRKMRKTARGTRAARKVTSKPARHFKEAIL